MTKKFLFTLGVLAHLAFAASLTAKNETGESGLSVFYTEAQDSASLRDAAAPSTGEVKATETARETTQDSTSAPRVFHRDTFKIYYRWDKSGLDTTYMNNAATIHRMDSLLKVARLDSVSLISSSSPEGNVWYNDKLSRKRGETMRGHLAKTLHEGMLGSMSVIPLGSNYPEFLRMVKESKGLPYRNEVVDEFEKHPGEHPDAIFKRVIEMREGRPYTYIRRNILRYLRYAEIVVVSHPIFPAADSTLAEPLAPELSEDIDIENFAEDTIKNAEVGLDSLRAQTIVTRPPLSEDIEIEEPQDTVENTEITLDSLRVDPLQEPADSVAPRKYWYPAMKSNLLFDAVTALNAEIEFPIGKHFSIAFEDLFPWWDWGPNGKKYCFQLWEMGLEPRWWFIRNDRKDYLSGHFAGVYGMSGKYDFQWDTALCYQGEFWSVGLTYGYALPVCKWLNMEFSISAGFLQSDYRHYQPDEAYEHLYRDRYKVGKISWFGPTKAKISLVIPIGKDSHNARSKAASTNKDKKQQKKSRKK